MIHHAGLCRNKKAFSFLLEKGAGTVIKDKDGQTADDYFNGRTRGSSKNDLMAQIITF